VQWREKTEESTSQAACGDTPEKDEKTETWSAIVPAAPAPIVDYLRKEALAAPSIQETIQKHKHPSLHPEDAEIWHRLRPDPGTNARAFYNRELRRLRCGSRYVPILKQLRRISAMGTSKCMIAATCCLFWFTTRHASNEKRWSEHESAVKAIISASELCKRPLPSTMEPFPVSRGAA